LSKKTFCSLLENIPGLSEHCDAVTGRPLRIPDYSMAATILTPMLDGLTKAHPISLKR
jgi:hypothetical protein